MCPQEGNGQEEERERSFGSRLLKWERNGSFILLPIALLEGEFSAGNLVE